MATRCGCSGACSCAVQAGDGITVTGNGSSANPWVISTGVAGARDLPLLVQAPADAVVTGDGQLFFVVPASLNGATVTAVHCATPAAAASSGITTVQLARIRSGSPVDVLSTKSTIDATELTSYSAAVPSVVNGANAGLLTGDILRVDVDVAGSGAQGLQVIVSYTS